MNFYDEISEIIILFGDFVNRLLIDLSNMIQLA